MERSGDGYIDLLTKTTKQTLAYQDGCDYLEWKSKVKAKFEELLGIEVIRENSCPLNFRLEEEKQKEGYKQYRFLIESEWGADVVCYLLIPDTGKEKYPVAITLQGHHAGAAKMSINEPNPDEPSHVEYANGRGCFAVQAVKHGFAALAIEQRGMGERRPKRWERNANMCTFEGLTSLLFGRTILGGRVWDISRAIDALINFSQCDTDKILITGNSGGGTASYYAACFDERIKLCVPSCAFCPYEYSILHLEHCVCNYIPQMYRYCEMQDLACLIAPRNFVPVSGKKDGIFLIDGVRKAMDTVKKIYTQENAVENCRFVETEKGHWWCEDIVWTAVREETEKMGWNR